MSDKSKARKSRLDQLQLLTRPQLIALAMQKEVVAYQVAVTLTAKQLVSAMVDVDDVLVPVVA